MRIIGTEIEPQLDWIALTDAIAGLDDFELICFLAVQAMPQAA